MKTRSIGRTLKTAQCIAQRLVGQFPLACALFHRLGGLGGGGAGLADGLLGIALALTEFFLDLAQPFQLAVEPVIGLFVRLLCRLDILFFDGSREIPNALLRLGDLLGVARCDGSLTHRGLVAPLRHVQRTGDR